jgi:hypothetical protein
MDVAPNLPMKTMASPQRRRRLDNWIRKHFENSVITFAGLNCMRFLSYQSNNLSINIAVYFLKYTYMASLRVFKGTISSTCNMLG